MDKYIFNFLLLILLSGSWNFSFGVSTEKNVFDSLEENISTGNDSIPLILQDKISLAKLTGDSLTEARGYYVLGKYYLVNSFNYPTAYNYFLAALSIFERSNEIKATGKCEMQIGVLYYLQRNFYEAQNYFESAFKKMVLTDDSVRIGRLAYLLGLTYSEEKEHEKAFNYLDISKRFVTTGSIETAKSEYEYGMGMYYLNKNNGDSALYFLNHLLEIAKANNNMLLIQRYSAEIAEAWNLKKNSEKTEYYARQVISAGRTINTEHAFVTCYHLLYEIALNKNDYKKAVDYLNKYILLKDSMINEKNLFELASLRTKFSLEKARQESSFRESQQQAIIKQQKSLKNIFIAGSLFGLFFVIFLIYANNIKKKKNLELAETLEKLKSTQEQLIHQEKLVSMGRLSAGIAHEMRNPLNFINNFSEVSAEMVNEIENASTEEEKKLITRRVIDNISKITEHGKRAQSIVNQIIEQVQTSQGKRELTDIHPICDSYLKMVMNSVSMNLSVINHKFIKNYNPNLPLVLVNPNEIGRVLTNIFSNSFQAIEEKLIIEKFIPEIRIKTFVENKQLCITVTDNGIGIKKEFTDKIFDSFFTTQKPGKGAGLGLSVANDIVKSYGGSINVKSEPLVYTSITVQIPV